MTVGRGGRGWQLPTFLMHTRHLKALAVQRHPRPRRLTHHSHLKCPTSSLSCFAARARSPEVRSFCRHPGRCCGRGKEKGGKKREEKGQSMRIAVGTVIADRPPHRSVRAELPHTAPTSDDDLRTARWDKGGGLLASGASGGRVWRTCPRSCGVRVGCGDAACGARCPSGHLGIVAGVDNCRGQHNTGTSLGTRCIANDRSRRDRHGLFARFVLLILRVWPDPIISLATQEVFRDVLRWIV